MLLLTHFTEEKQMRSVRETEAQRGGECFLRANLLLSQEHPCEWSLEKPVLLKAETTVC